MNRIHRLPPLFWIGLLPVVILLGAWADSLSYHSMWLHGKEANGRDTLSLRNSVLAFARTRAVKVPGSSTIEGMPWSPGGTGRFNTVARYEWSPGRIALTIGGRVDEKRWFPRAEKIEIGPISGFATGFTVMTQEWIVPLWLLLASYLPLWLGISWWQARRRRKRLEAMDPRAGDFEERQ
ncbi:hypothetical protein [Haloferula sp. BvORR071]|uniref:hypothetical protein n=1 Tax=Haloferula sp. BvORR071 TaxID=1396141 RepID=UPI0005575E8C|nr:hypothetical protein [Haloferula sp. BvORR071]